MGATPFDLSEDQALFHQTTLRFIESELPLDRSRSLHADPMGYERAWLRRAADLGWFAMLVPEEAGGGSISGAGLLDAAIVAVEVGSHVQPGPFIPMNIVAGALAGGGSDRQRAELLPAIVSGEMVATWAFADTNGEWDGGAGVRVERSGPELVLTGARGFVQEAVSADWFLVVATIDHEPAEILVRADAPGVNITPLSCLDLSRRLGQVTLEGVSVSPDAVLEACGLAPIERQLGRAVALNCADTVGAVDTLFAMTVAYAKDRIAFGRPVGSFQAVKHILADQALHLEACKAAVVAAARAVQAADETATEVTSMASAYVGDVANEVAQECLQVHGGIGYTWEHDLHLLLRRIRSNSALYGEPTWHRERVCAFYEL